MKQPIRVQRKRTKGYKLPPNTVYVGRPTRWGNPFKVGHHINENVAKITDPIILNKATTVVNAEHALELYRIWLTGDYETGYLKLAHRNYMRSKPSLPSSKNFVERTWLASASWMRHAMLTCFLKSQTNDGPAIQ